MSNLRINQMGFCKVAPKSVAYTGKATSFQVIKEPQGEVVFQGDFASSVWDESSMEQVAIGVFDEVREEGTYRIQVNAKDYEECSGLFAIGNDQVSLCNDALLKAFYYQRCGMELVEAFAGPWKHSICHMQKAVLFDQQDVEVDTSGGWHDAGDYGRYTVAAAKAVADLLLAYELYPSVFQREIGIPESHLPGADLLHEVKYELEFMMKMQREDGAVYTKVATRYFPGMIMPEVDLEPLYIFDISSPATGDFAASMAMAARVYRSVEESFAQKCLACAVKAYQWLLKNPAPLLFTNPPDINSGEYGDDSDWDERYWAAAELYATTGNHIWKEEVYRLIQSKSAGSGLGLGWADVGGYGTIACLLHKDLWEDEFYKTIKEEWLQQASIYQMQASKSGYAVTLSPQAYIWGSNMVLLNQSMHMIVAMHIAPEFEAQYQRVVYANWDYLFGKNPMDLSYVTGLGKRAILAPHHRPSDADGVEAPVPGLVSGGPCAGLYDDIVKQHCQGQPPAKAFLDHVDSYSTNEITIYWNSPAVFVGAYLEANM